MIDPLEITKGMKLRVLKDDLNSAGVESGDILEVTKVLITFEGIVVRTAEWGFAEHINIEDESDFNFLERV